jgi:hypothetical protein
VRHQFVRLFRRRVEAQRMIHVVVYGEGHTGVGPVDGAR